MTKRVMPEEEAIGGVEDAREYAEKHRKYAGLMYRALLKDMKALAVSGQYLEVGAGPGFLSIMVAEANSDAGITATDISPDMAAVAGEYVAEKGLQDRIRYLVADAGDEKSMRELGQFDLVYSAYSLHHWKDAEASISNLWGAVRDGGTLFIHDFKRVWWLYYLPFNSGEVRSVRASYTPREIRAVLTKLGIANHSVKTRFPFFLQSIIAHK
jgi:2-polyprenyl-3-methyl-5-hydroxy-6-metoxy-1,4-benzoquinol methylase